MASSAQNQHHHFPTPYAVTSAPPPTPSSAQPTTSDSPIDLLSRLLHRLPPTLSATPNLRRSSPPPTIISPPVIPFPDLNSSLSLNLPSISQLGFFQLTNHSISSQLAHSAESDSLSLFNLSTHHKHQYFPRSWPLGFNEDEDDTAASESLLLDSSCSTESSELSLSSLREFTREMEKVGLAVVAALSCALGLENPARYDPSRVCSLMWISNGSDSPADRLDGSGKFYPYVVGLHYGLRSQKCSMLADSGWVSVSWQMDSILVTLGDIAQVWSNDKLKKVRGKPVPSDNNPSSISMSLIVTLPLESTVSPLLPIAVVNNRNEDDYCHDKDQNQEEGGEEEKENVFNSFEFEDYAWRVYHERIHIKDSLDRYRS